MKDCWVDEVVLFKYGNWTIPRTYLEFNVPNGDTKLIYCGFFKVCRLEFKRDIKLSDEIWSFSPSCAKKLDERFYIKEGDKIRQPKLIENNSFIFGKQEIKHWI